MGLAMASALHTTFDGLVGRLQRTHARARLGAMAAQHENQARSAQFPVSEFPLEGLLGSSNEKGFSASSQKLRRKPPESLS